MKPIIRIAVFFSLGLLAFCNNPEKQAESAIRQYFSDYAFKNNTEIKTLEISGLTLSEVGENYFDTLRLSYIAQEISRSQNLVDATTELLKSRRQLAELYRSLDRTLFNTAVEDAKETLEQARLYMDTLKIFIAQDSTIRQRIKHRKDDSKEYYKAKFLLKLAIPERNILDTSVILLNKKMEVVWPEMM